jgi:hypothetical protein
LRCLRCLLGQLVDEVVDAGSRCAQPGFQTVPLRAEALQLAQQQRIRSLQFLVAQQESFDPFCELLKLCHDAR